MLFDNKIKITHICLKLLLPEFDRNFTFCGGQDKSSWWYEFQNRYC